MDKIEIKTPSEHVISTKVGTKNTVAELLIYHTINNTSNTQVTNTDQKINRLVISLLYVVDQSSLEGDPFLDLMGISGDLVNSVQYRL